MESTMTMIFVKRDCKIVSVWTSTKLKYFTDHVIYFFTICRSSFIKIIIVKKNLTLF